MRFNYILDYTVLVLRRLQEPSRAVSRATISRAVSLSAKLRRWWPCHLAALSRAVKQHQLERGSAPKLAQVD